MSVSVSGCSLSSVGNMAGGGFLLSMIVRSASVTARMSCGLYKFVRLRSCLVLFNTAVGGIGISAVRVLVGFLAGEDVTEVAC